MLKSNFTNKKMDTVSYPCLRKSLDKGKIVLFSAPTKGTVLHSGETEDCIGYHSHHWVSAEDASVWGDVSSVTITQE